MTVRFRPARGPGATAQRAARPGIQLGILPFVVMAVVAAADLLAGPGVGFLPLLSLGPALAAVSLRPAQTALVGGLALVLCVGLAVYDGLDGSRRGVIALVSVAGVTAAGAIASAGRRQRERELANVTAVAEVAQRVLIRPVPRQVGPLQVAVRYVSAAASARIGGDLYDVVAAGGTVRLIVGDVQGKGLGAVQTAAAVLGAFREAAYEAPDLPALAARIELSLGRQVADEEFVTAVLAQVGDDASRVEILNCGHPPPVLLCRSGTRLIEPDGTGLPFGLAGLAPAGRSVDVVALGPGERILFYTDGITEARDEAGTFYRLDGAILDGLGPEDALDRLYDDVIRHVGHRLLDDAAMLLIGRTAVAAPPGGGKAGAGNGCAEPSTVRPAMPGRR